MMEVPDAPWIREAENDGDEPGPEYDCPLCGKRCETIYTDSGGDVAGCDRCMTTWEPEEWWEAQHGKE